MVAIFLFEDEEHATKLLAILDEMLTDGSLVTLEN